MVRFGIHTLEEFARALGNSRSHGVRAAYQLLDVGENPSEERIQVFEDISFALRTSNGTFRTTFRHRFQDVDTVVLKWMEKVYPSNAPLAIEDRAVSHALTSWEWAERLLAIFPQARFEASDILLELIELSCGNEAFVVEPNGRPIQYVRPPFVVSLQHQEPRRYPLNRLVAARAKKRFANLALPVGWMEQAQSGAWKIRRIPYIHPHARELSRRNPNFQVRLRSVFEISPVPCDVLRTMNIFNRSYFSDQELRNGFGAVHRSLAPGGLWMIGRTLEEDFSNHATLFRRQDQGWEVLERIGGGSEMEEFALRGSVGA